jgi:hypothetical protein
MLAARSRAFAAIVLALVLSSIAVFAAGPRSLAITYYSDPAGATLYEGGKNHGRTPVTLKYKVTKNFKAGKECMTLTPLMVRWVSGAEASMPSGFLACPHNGGKQQFTFARPNVPNRELDVQFMMQLEANGQQDSVRCNSVNVKKMVYTSCR